MILLLGVLALLTLDAAGVRAQTPANYNPRDDKYRLLGMTRAQADFEQAQREIDRIQRLRSQGLAADAELESARARLENARVNYIQAALAVVFASPHVMIDRAVKLQRPDGRRYVRVTLRNEAQSGAEGDKLREIIDSSLLRQLKPDEVPNVFVSLKDEPGQQGVIVSSPYERLIPMLRFGKPVTLEFRLLKELDAVTVSVSYADAVTERRVLLEKDASANIVSVQSSQFSQEADLGGTATYDLALERFTGDAGGVRLAVGGLPRGVRAEFRDPASNARLTQIRFPEGSTSMRLSLVLTLPERTGSSFALDRPLAFWALALDSEAALRFDRLAADSLTSEEAASIAAGKARLVLVPRGIARIELRAPNFYHEIGRGDSVVMTIRARNIGSRVASGIRVTPDAQADWRSTVSPELIERIPADSEAELTLTLVPPRQIAVGDYDVRLLTDAMSADRRVDVDDKVVRIRVVPPANWLGTGALIAVLVAVLGGMVMFGLRLTKR